MKIDVRCPLDGICPAVEHLFWVSDVEALHAEFVECGAKIDYGLCDQPYGCREFGTQDIDGHDIGFGQAVE